MVVWLPSYPRSGNTLLRMMLKEAFSLDSFSRYNDIADIGSDPTMIAKVGHRQLPAPWPQAFDRLRRSPKLALVKTHSAPESDDPAIFVVRHGWAAVLSHQKYLRDFTATESDLPSIIAGLAGGVPSWGRLLDLWAPDTRPHTLLLRYEDLVANPGSAIERIAEFLRRGPVKSWTNNFAEMQQLNPRFFRSGRTTVAPEDLKADHAALFAQLHGDWMGKIHYTDLPPESVRNCRFLRRAIEHNPFLAEPPSSPPAAPKHQFSLRNAATECLRLEKIVTEQTAYIAALERQRDEYLAPLAPPPAR